MSPSLPNPDLVQPVESPASEVPDLRAVPLNQLADIAEMMLRRIIPQQGTERVPVAAFDASL